MFNAQTIEDTFIPMVGVRKNDDPQAANNPMGDLLTASSGLYLNDIHSLLTTNNLSSISPKFDTFTYTAWSALTTYAKGDIATSSGSYYVSLQNSNLNQAVGDLTAYWRKTNPFNEWLRSRMSSAWLEFLHDWFNMKFENQTARNLIADDQVLNFPGNKSEAIGDTDRYLGWMIVPYPRMGVTIKIDRICMTMLSSENLTVRLYKNGIATGDVVNFTGTGHPHPLWKQAGWTLERGNYYYVAYDRNTLSAATPVNGLVNVVKNWPDNYFPGRHRRFAEVCAFQTDDLTSDLTDERTNTNNFGLNLTMSARCDYTEFIVDQKDLFVHAGRMKLGIAFLSELMSNPNARINGDQLNAEQKAEIYFAINGSPKEKTATGLVADFRRALNSISFDMPGLQHECLPCTQSGVIYTKS